MTKSTQMASLVLGRAKNDGRPRLDELKNSLKRARHRKKAWGITLYSLSN